MIGEVIAAMIGTVSFSLLFGVPQKYYVSCGLIGGIGWIVYGLLRESTSIPIAVLVATLLVTLLSRVFAVWWRCPVTLFLIPGIFPLVPGAGIYWTAHYIVTNELNLALEHGFMAVKVAVSIVLGIVFIFEIPQRLFYKARLVQKGRK